MTDEKFHLVSNYAPTGDQPQAIQQLVEGLLPVEIHAVKRRLLRH